MKLVSLILVLFSFTNGSSQNVQKNNDKIFYLEGHLDGRDTGFLILSYYNNKENWIQDTTYLEKGNFKFKGQISQPTYAVLKGYYKEINFEEVNYVGVFLEPTNQYISLMEDDYQNAKIEGSKTQKENALLIAQINDVKFKWKNLNDEFLKAKDEFLKEKDTTLKNKKGENADILFEKLQPSNKEIENVVISFISHYPNSYVSASMLFNPINDLSLDSSKLLYNKLTAKIKNSRDGKLLSEIILKKEQSEIGVNATNFNAVSIDAKKFSLHDLQGKFVLIDFWASWCIPCRETMPQLRKLYKQYHTKGFEIISISVDRNKTDWEEAVAEEKISNWYNVLVNEQINKNYENVHLPIPSNILINKSGKIIWKSNNKNNNNSLEGVLSAALSK